MCFIKVSSDTCGPAGFGWSFRSWQSTEAWSLFLQAWVMMGWKGGGVFGLWYQRLDKAGNALTSLRGGPENQLCEVVKIRGGYCGNPRTIRDALRKADVMEWSQPGKDCVLRAAELEDCDGELQDLVRLFLAVSGIFHLGIRSSLCAILFWKYVTYFLLI